MKPLDASLLTLGFVLFLTGIVTVATDRYVSPWAYLATTFSIFMFSIVIARRGMNK